MLWFSPFGLLAGLGMYLSATNIICSVNNFLYSAPSFFEHYFRKELPLLYKYLQEAPADKVVESYKLNASDRSTDIPFAL